MIFAILEYKRHSRQGISQVSHFKAAGLKFGRLLDVTDYQLMLLEK